VLTNGLQGLINNKRIKHPIDKKAALNTLDAISTPEEISARAKDLSDYIHLLFGE
jgi:hypothetical protein